MNDHIEKTTIEIIEAQRDLAMKLNSATKFDELLDLCLESAITISGMDAGGIYMVDENSGDIELKSYKGLSDEFVSIGKHYKADSPHTELIMKGDPVYITIEQIESLLNGFQKKEGLKSLAILPVKNKNRAIACINVASHTKSEMHHSLIIPLETMLAVIGSSIARMQSEKSLKQSEEKFSKAFNSNSVVMAISEIDSGRFIEVNDTFLKLLGYQRVEVIGKTSKELGMFKNSGQRKVLMNQLKGKNKIIDVDIEVINKKGETLIGLFYADIIEINEDPFLLTVMQDITKRKNAELKLKKSLAEKNILLKEIHHRVKNNLQIISSLLDLQSRSIGDDKLKEAFEYSQGRIRSMAMVHEMIYKSDNLSEINCKNFLESLISEISRFCKNDSCQVQFKYDIDDIVVGLETAIPCTLIINELITNSLQYAFKDLKKGIIKISLKQKNNMRQLKIKDNGIGIGEDIDISKAKTLGLRLVNILAKQINGEVQINNNKGTEIIINFES